MTRLAPARADHASPARRSTLVDAGAFGLLVVLALGVTRGGVQVVARGAYASPLPVLAALLAVSAFWLPVPTLVARISALPGPALARLCAHAAAVALVAAAEPVWTMAVLPWAGGPSPRGGYWVNAALRLDTNLLIYAAIGGLLWLRRAERRRLAIAESAARLRARAGDAELDVLTMQLQPHFLFNTLNLVSQLAYESVARARRALRNLRDLLRESIEHGAARTVSLGEELRFLEAYLDLQRERFGARLDARVAVDVDLLAARVPHMILQPVVENAIRHGVARRGSGGSVRVTGRRADGDRLVIEIADDGPGLRPGSVREGIGLANVRHRLEHLSGGDARVTLRERPGGGTVACVDVPFVTAVAAEAVPAPEDEIAIGERATAGEAPAMHPAPPRAVVRATAIVAGWALVAAVWTELEAVVPFASGRSVQWSDLFAANGVNAAVWVAITPLALWLADRLAARGRAWRLGAHALGAAAFTAVHLTATGALMRVLLRADAASIRGVRISWAVWDAMAYVALVLLAEALAARARLEHEALDAARARTRLAAARVALLRLQLQPGILLGGLDAVAQAIDDPVRCETVIARLGDVLRLLLASAGREDTTLDRELALLDACLQVRSGEPSLASVAAECRRAAVPAVLLQPLAAAIGARRARVTASRALGHLVIELVADGETEHPADGEKFAAVERRLRALYGEDHELRLVHRDGAAGVHLELPYRERVVVAAAPEPPALAIA